MLSVLQLCTELLADASGSVTIYVSSRSFWCSLRNSRIATQLLRDLWLALNRLASRCNLQLAYVAEARAETQLLLQTAHQSWNEGSEVSFSTPPIRFVYNKLLRIAWRMQSERWRYDGSHRQSHIFLPRSLPHDTQVKWLLRLPRPWVYTFVGILTGHNTLNRHLAIMGVILSEVCTYCDQQAPESAEHFMCTCTAYNHLRGEIYGRESISAQEASANWAQMLNFMLHTGRFTCDSAVIKS